MTVFLLTPPGQRHEHEILRPRFLAQTIAHLVAIEPRKADVEEGDIGTELLCRLNRLDTVVSNMSLVPGQLQQHGK